jgi:hypothetical protein
MLRNKWDLLRLPGMGGREIKENDGGCDFKYDVFEIL